jgi:hypothetical protein
MLNKKLKPFKIFKKFILLTLASTVGLSSGAVFTGLVNPIQGQTSANGVLDTRYDWQTQYLVDVNNMIIPDCVMHAKMNYSNGDIANNAFPQSVDLTFDLKGYDPSKLNFRILQQAKAEPEYKDYVLDSSTQKIHLTVSDGTTAGDVERLNVYEVRAYNGSISEENLIGKGKFLVVCDFRSWGKEASVTKFPLIDSKGDPVIYRGNEITDFYGNAILQPGNQVSLTFAKSNLVNGKVMCALPTELFPFDARSIKVVAFASNPDYRYYRTINIDKYMYPSYQNDCIQLKADNYDSRGTNAPYLIWAPDIMDFKSVDGQPVKFEFHFYKDNVLKEQFLFKAVDVTLT